MTALTRPDPSEHAEYYARYIAAVPDGDILETLRDQLGETLELLTGLSEEQQTYRYAEGKWSLREVVGHVIDTERVFAYRALSMARADNVDLPGMDQEEWASTSNANERSLEEMAAEWVALRRANVHMFAAMNSATGERSGIASGFTFTVRSFAWIMAGHELWHRSLIQRDYLPATTS